MKAFFRVFVGRGTTALRHGGSRWACVGLSIGSVLFSGVCLAQEVALAWTSNAGIEAVTRDAWVVETLHTYPSSSTFGLANDGDHFYWSDNSSNEVYRRPLFGGPTSTIATGQVVLGLAIHESSQTLFMGNELNQVVSANLDGTNPQVIVNSNRGPVGLAVDSVNGKLYWAQVFDGIYQSNLDGSGAQRIVATGSSSAPAQVAVDPTNGNIYWTDNRGDTVSRADLDGTNAQTIVNLPTFTNPVGIGIDASEDKLYWISNGDRTLSRSDLDGTNVQVVATGLDDPLNLTVYTVPEPASLALLMTAGAVVGLRRRRP